MRRTFALLLAAVMAAGTLTGPAMAAESQQEGTADSASQEVQEETKLPPDPEGTVTWANLGKHQRSTASPAPRITTMKKLTRVSVTVTPR